MIPQLLRDRIEAFIKAHEECEGACEIDCVFDMAEDWVDEMQARGFPREELMIMALAYLAYVGREYSRRDGDDDFVPPPPEKPALKLVRP